MSRKNLGLRSTLWGLFISASMLFLDSTLATAPRYPVISHWQGSVWLTGQDGKRQVVRAKTVLRDKAVLETSATGQVKVLLDEKRSFTVLESSELSLPAISWEGGEAPVLFLRSGELLWQQANEKPLYNTALTSALFEFLAPPGEYILSINPQQAYASVTMIDGMMDFSAINGEEVVRVRSGQQAGFQGVLEDGEIAYDVLLKGRKIPKGTLTKVTPIDTGALDKKTELDKKIKIELANQQRQKEASAAKALKAGTICEKPSGRLNECAWVCQGNPKGEKKLCRLEKRGVACLRSRCNANGIWSETTPVDFAKASGICKAQAVVAPCDY